MDVDLGAGQRLSLVSVDPSGLDAGARVDALIELQRMRSWVDAQEQVLLAAMVEPGEPPRSWRDETLVDKQFVREEIACALRISPLTVNARLHVARELTRRLPAALDPRTAEAKHDTAVQQRRVESQALADGMGSLYAVLPADDLQAIMVAVQACADALPDADYPAGPHAADQRRADALVALTTGGAVPSVARRHGRRPTVQVTVALSTLLGLDDQPGELDGHGPIPAVLARRIAADASGTWRRLVTDALGRLIDYGHTVYQPPQDLTDHVIARDRRCRFPHCRRQAVRCDLDHQTAWNDGGTTNDRNLECLCARHHALKHEAGWTVRGDPAGVLTWTSPTGHTYLDPPGEHPIDGTTDAVDQSSIDDAGEQAA